MFNKKKYRNFVRDMIYCKYKNYRGDIKMIKLDEDKILNQLNELWTNKTCPYCQHSQWTIESGLSTTLTVNDNAGVEIGGKIYPFALVTCNKCGHTVLVNAKVIDCVEEGEDKANG